MWICSFSHCDDTLKYDRDWEEERLIGEKISVVNVCNLTIDIKEYFHFDFFVVKPYKSGVI